MIRSFRNKQLELLWTTGRSKIDARLHKRILVRLERLDSVTEVEDMNLTGYNFHTLRGFSPTRYTVHINGPWCLTFSFEESDALNVDFEQYH